MQPNISLFLSTLFVISFLVPAPVHSCERHCRNSILSSIQELFNPRLLVAHQTFYQTLFINLPTEVSQPLVQVINDIVYNAQQAAIDPGHVLDAQSIRGIFRPQVPHVGVNVTGFSGPDCCPKECTKECCSDKKWPNVTTVFTKGEKICGSEYSTATNLDLVFEYAQTILGVQSQFASVDSVGSLALTQQVAQQMGSNNSWLARFLGNLHLAIKNLQTAYTLLKSDFEPTYPHLSTYLICIDHTLDRPKFHPLAYTENCTKPTFSVPIPYNALGYQFPPENYITVDEIPKSIQLDPEEEVKWEQDISAELTAVLKETYEEQQPKRYMYSAVLTELDGVAVEAKAEVGGEVVGAGNARCIEAVTVGIVVVAALVFVF